MYECAYLKSTDIYNLVDIRAIDNLVHIIPRFGKSNEYLLNNYLF